MDGWIGIDRSGGVCDFVYSRREEQEKHWVLCLLWFMI